MRRTENPITDGLIGPQLIRYFFPIFLGSLFQQLYSTADAIIVGLFDGAAALAAIEATGSMLRLFVFLFVGASTGATILISQHYGARRFGDVSETTHTGLVLSLIGGALLTGLGMLLLPTGLDFLRVPDEILKDAHTYAWIYLTGLIPAFLYNMAAGAMRAIGDTRRPLIFLMISTLTNIALDILLVAVCRWGVAGAAVATVLSQFLSAALSLLALMRTTEPCRLIPGKLRIAPGALKAIARAGLPISVQSCMYPIANIVVQSHVNAFGTNTIAGWAVSGKVDMIFWLIVDSLSVSCCTFVAQNYGAGRLDRARRSVHAALAISMAILVPLAALLYVYSVPLSRLFIQNEAVVQSSAALLRMVAPYYPLFVFGELFSSAIRGSGETFRPMLVTMLGTCALRIAWCQLAVPRNPTIGMVLVCFPLSWAVTDVLFWVYYRRHTRVWRRPSAAGR